MAKSVNNEFKLPTGLILQAGLLIGGFLVGKKILEKVGVLKTEKEQEEEKKAASATNTTNMNGAANP